MRSLIILGRQPALGLAELESLYGPEVLRPVGERAVSIDLEPKEINFARLGGMVKFAKILTILDTTNWGDIQKFLESVAPGHAANLPEGKLRLGFSAYGLGVTPQRIQATGLALKKVIRSTGRSVRYVPNVEPELNAAQVLHNQLTQKLGWELLFVRGGGKTIVAQSIAVQDIEAYRRRDQQRPYRDARVGMLPPKLAQIIINLANPPSGGTILDPFCGTGVLLQEALLMNYGAYGSDLDKRMVEYSEGNLKWLTNTFRLPLACSDDLELETPQPINSGRYHLEIADATSASWKSVPSAIAAETYLGRPLSSLPDQEILQKIMNDCDTIHKKFLRNITRQTKPGLRLCLAVPAWKTKAGFKHLRMLDSLGDLGYNRIRFVHASSQDLIYHREGQIVARELVVLERK